MNIMTLIYSRPYLPYVIPMALFALFTYAEPLLGIPQSIVYPFKTVMVGGILFCFRQAFKAEIRFELSWLALLSGIAVFLVWILPEGLYPQLGHSTFNPFEQAQGVEAWTLIAFRLTGAALIVPVMEELFWRSFALRFLIHENFKTVPLGKFTWFSFILVSLAFGFEHHRWLVGIFAGLVYAGVLYRTKNLFVPVLSHAVTNLLLGIYVIYTGKWFFW